MGQRPKVIPKIVLVMKPVDGGSAMIGVMECPNCGKEHFTTNISCGERTVFCGLDADASDGYTWVCVERIV